MGAVKGYCLAMYLFADVLRRAVLSLEKLATTLKLQLHTPTAASLSPDHVTYFTAD